jgi:citrate lyase beta subunit
MLPQDRVGIVGPHLPPHTPAKGGKEAETTRLGKLLGGWRRNALRHSFLSYRAAQVGIAQAAREAGKPILDGVYNDIKNADGFRSECEQGAQMGFDGKTLIHPDQVVIANDVWAPSEAEIEHARRVIDAFDDGLASGKGVVQLDGRMIENLHVDNARRTLAIADAIASL